MAEISGLTTLDKLARKILFKKREGNENYLRYLSVLTEGLQRLNYHYVGHVKTDTLSVDTDTNTVDYPDDYVNYVSLSVADDIGKMWTFTRDEKIFLT